MQTSCSVQSVIVAKKGALDLSCGSIAQGTAEDALTESSSNHRLWDLRAHNMDLQKFFQILGRTAIADRDQLLSQQEKLCQEITEFSTAGRIWEETSHHQAAVQRLNAQELQIQSLYEILNGLGWKDMIDSLEYLRRETLIFGLRAGAQDSRDAATLKRAEVRAVRFLEQVKIRRRRGNYVEQYTERLRIMKEAVLSFRRDFGPSIFPLFPRYHEFATLPEFEQIITAPLSQIVTLDTFTRFAPMMPRYLEDWKQETLRSLEVLLRYTIESDLPENVQVIDLAIGQFVQCGTCDLILDLRRAPHHDCFDMGRDFSGRTDFELAVKGSTNSRRHNHFRPLAEFLRDLLIQCGLDYRQVTVQEMDQLAILFCCRRCKLDYWKHEAREVMNWRAVVRIHRFNQPD
ncbi:hypothetical protein NLI96_g2118 [Meripilus lineatus]|uniref:Uncharacterized protein n=1 Tax=Meripilus lineatus TaxID=2056292 RepID=A0AAD5YMA6_9APHY|nr:hypothetical protein NLI96_g2118 [Physisporinus lineatus]